jgi:hypothetical protein
MCWEYVHFYVKWTFVFEILFDWCKMNTFQTLMFGLYYMHIIILGVLIQWVITINIVIFAGICCKVCELWRLFIMKSINDDISALKNILPIYLSVDNMTICHRRSRWGGISLSSKAILEWNRLFGCQTTYDAQYKIVATIRTDSINYIVSHIFTILYSHEHNTTRYKPTLIH